MICPYCKKDVVPEFEDNRCDTDRGTMGEVNYFCPNCEKDITDEAEAEIKV